MTSIGPKIRNFHGVENFFHAMEKFRPFFPRHGKLFPRHGKIRPVFSTPWKLFSTPWKIRTFLALAALPAAGQAYDAAWHTLDGGGVSTGQHYRLSGAIGQPDAGPILAGGGYAAQGGFWARPILVQLAEGPRLHLSIPSPGHAIVTWTPDVGAHVLQTASNLQSGVWLPAPTGSTNPAALSIGPETRYFRLAPREP